MPPVGKVKAAQWYAAHEQGLVCFGIEGEVCPATGAQLLAASSAYMTEAKACGLVADYTGARVLLTAEQLTANMRRAAATSRMITTPTALVVRRDDTALFLTYARALSQFGVLRGVFNEFEPARRWASEQARIHEAERRTPRAG